LILPVLGVLSAVRDGFDLRQRHTRNGSRSAGCSGRRWLHIFQVEWLGNSMAV
jgi:hypothetical protein